jgi:hypothetical protein
MTGDGAVGESKKGPGKGAVHARAFREVDDHPRGFPRFDIEEQILETAAFAADTWPDDAQEVEVLLETNGERGAGRIRVHGLGHLTGLS